MADPRRAAFSFDPRRRRESFDSVAAEYDRYRSLYPEEVIADVVTSARIGAGSRVLEIACGTGQLSGPIAALGVDLNCVELGPSLAAIARRNLAQWPNVVVENVAFEDWAVPAEPFDAVLCASAFHWLDPKVRIEKPAQALRAGGALVVVNPHQVLGGTPGFSEASQEFYIKWGLSDDPLFSPPAPADVPIMFADLEEGGEFEGLERHRFADLRPYTAETYTGLLRTDSLILGLDEQARQGFLSDMRALIDGKFGGEITRLYLCEVIVARRTPGP
jgi:protein-L-isoaspartate O-methyltransferase